MDAGMVLPCTRIWVPEHLEQLNTSYSILALNPKDGKVDKEITFAGKADNTVVAMFEDNIYVTHRETTRAFEVVLDFFETDLADLLSEKARARITTIRGYDISNASKMEEISNVIESEREGMDSNEALRFEGFTAAYIQYTYARISSIIRKAGAAKKIQFSKIEFGNLKEISEHKLSIALAKFSEAIEKASASYNPATLAEYLYSLAKCFNDFYRDVPVLKADNEVRLARVALLEATRIVLENGLNLLGIEAPERM